MNMDNTDEINNEITVDIKDCTFIGLRRIADGRLIINALPDLAIIDCSICNDLAEYTIYVVASNKDSDLIAHLCAKHYKALDRLEELAVPVAVTH